MSNIEENLAFILSSRYGEDVRQAIHDAIHDCYEDGKAGAVDLIAREQIADTDEKLSAQIANLVANAPSGSEKDSELVDIRVGYKGTTYQSAGEAVRGQAGKLSEEIDELKIGLDYLITLSEKYNGKTADFWTLANNDRLYKLCDVVKGDKLSNIKVVGEVGTIPKLYIIGENNNLKNVINLNVNTGDVTNTVLNININENGCILIGGCVSSFKFCDTNNVLSGETDIIVADNIYNIGDTVAFETVYYKTCYSVELYAYNLSDNIYYNLVNKRPYSPNLIFFKITSDKSFNSTDTSKQVIDTPNNMTSWCVLKLPTSYLPNGKKTKLCVFMHGSNGSFDNSMSYENIEIYHADNLVKSGYAVMDVSIDDYHMASPIAMSMYRKAIQYVIDEYNVEDKIYLHGHSMGGWSALNFTNKFGNLVKVLGLWYPCVDAYNQAWNNSVWTQPKQYMPIFYNFSQTTNYEEDKVIGFNPIKTNTFEINGVKYTSLSCPIKIWHGQSDTMMPIQYSRDYVNALKNNGNEAYLREVQNLGHEWSDILKTEMLNWFNRF